MTNNSIWKFTLSNHNEIKSKMLDVIENYEQVNKCPDLTTKITKTDFYDKLEPKGYYNILQEGLSPLWTAISDRYWSSTFSNPWIWFQQYYRNDWHGWHMHGNSNISMSYFLELPDPKYSTEFVDIEDNKVFQLDASEGDVVIFPSFTIHRSPIIESDIRKTIIAINLSFVEPSLDNINSIFKK